MDIKKILFLLSFLLVVNTFASTAIPSTTQYVAPGEKQALYQFEHHLHTDYLIYGSKNNYHSITEQMQRYHVPGVSVVVIHNGKIAWIKSYGIKNSQTLAPVTPQTLFQVGSISKTFTALGALKLACSGQLNLDADINQYLLGWRVPKNDFTREQVVTARFILPHLSGTNVSGFPGIDSSVHPFPSIVDVLNGKKPAITTAPIDVIALPGKSFSYSGGGYSILQLAMQDVTMQDFPLWMNSHVLKPLGMTESTFEQPLPESYVTNASSAHNSQGEVYQGNYHNYPENAAAGLWSNPTELAKTLLTLMDAYYNEKSLPGINHKLTTELFTAQKPSNFGLGLMIQDKRSILTFGHDGGNDGFTASMTAYVNSPSLHSQHPLKDGLIITTNADNGGMMIHELAQSFTDTYHLKVYPVHYIHVSNSTKNLQKYVTHFSFPPEYGVDTCQVTLNKTHQLFLQCGQAMSQPTQAYQRMYPIGGNRLMNPFGVTLAYHWQGKTLHLKTRMSDGPWVNVVD